MCYCPGVNCAENFCTLKAKQDQLRMMESLMNICSSCVLLLLAKPSAITGMHSFSAGLLIRILCFINITLCSRIDVWILIMYFLSWYNVMLSSKLHLFHSFSLSVMLEILFYLIWLYWAIMSIVLLFLSVWRLVLCIFHEISIF